MPGSKDKSKMLSLLCQLKLINAVRTKVAPNEVFQNECNCFESLLKSTWSSKPMCLLYTSASPDRKSSRKFIDLWDVWCIFVQSWGMGWYSSVGRIYTGCGIGHELYCRSSHYSLAGSRVFAVSSHAHEDVYVECKNYCCGCIIPDILSAKQGQRLVESFQNCQTWK